MKQLLKDVTKISQMDWVRLAAFLDGEGHITIARQTSAWRNKRSPHSCQHVAHVSISNTDPRLPLWLLETFGGSVTMQQKRRKNPNWKDISHWRVTGRNAGMVINGCKPFLLLKNDQAEIVLAFQRLVESTELRGTRRPVSPEEWGQREKFCSNIHLLTARGKRKEAVNG